jgi:hypothetical protein
MYGCLFKNDNNFELLSANNTCMRIKERLECPSGTTLSFINLYQRGDWYVCAKTLGASIYPYVGASNTATWSSAGDSLTLKTTDGNPFYLIRTTTEYNYDSNDFGIKIINSANSDICYTSKMDLARVIYSGNVSTTSSGSTLPLPASKYNARKYISIFCMESQYSSGFYGNSGYDYFSSNFDGSIMTFRLMGFSWTFPETNYTHPDYGWVQGPSYLRPRRLTIIEA